MSLFTHLFLLNMNTDCSRWMFCIKNSKNYVTYFYKAAYITKQFYCFLVRNCNLLINWSVLSRELASPGKLKRSHNQKLFPDFPYICKSNFMFFCATDFWLIHLSVLQHRITILNAQLQVNYIAVSKKHVLNFQDQTK